MEAEAWAHQRDEGEEQKAVFVWDEKIFQEEISTQLIKGVPEPKEF